MALWPDGRIYLGVGSVHDARRSQVAPSAAVVSFPPEGGDLRVEARGLRNPYGLAFVPGTAMGLMRVRDPAERAAVIEYLQRHGP